MFQQGLRKTGASTKARAKATTSFQCQARRRTGASQAAREDGLLERSQKQAPVSMLHPARHSRGPDDAAEAVSRRCGNNMGTPRTRLRPETTGPHKSL